MRYELGNLQAIGVKVEDKGTEVTLKLSTKTADVWKLCDAVDRKETLLVALETVQPGLPFTKPEPRRSGESVDVTGAKELPLDQALNMVQLTQATDKATDKATVKATDASAAPSGQTSTRVLPGGLRKRGRPGKEDKK